MARHSRLYSVLSYITWLGFIIVLLMRDRNDPLVRRHLNQSLMLHIIMSVASIFSRIGGLFAVIAGVAGLACFVLWIMGILRALGENADPLPFIGNFQIL